MTNNRDLVFANCYPEKELAFSDAEYKSRLNAIRKNMAQQDIQLLWLMSPESMFYVSGYTCEWYQAQSPKQWPATSGIAIHVDVDEFILFDTPSEAVMCRFVTCAQDIRIFPMNSRRDGIQFIMDELDSSNWLCGKTGMEMHSYRPNPVISKRFESAFQTRGMEVVDSSDLIRDIRWIKSDAEIAYIEKAAKIADIGLTAAKNTLQPGVTELEVYGEIINAMSKAGGENPSITLPVLSGPKANTGHSLSSRRVIQNNEQVNVDVCGVYNRYHANGARSFYIGQPADEVLSYHEKSSNVFKVIESILKPGLTVSELVTTTKSYYEDIGIWPDAGWVGGYELGIGFPPDWVGNFVYEMTDTNSDRTFEAGTVVNFESQFFSPELSGITYYIDTLLFKEDEAILPLQTPRRLVCMV